MLAVQAFEIGWVAAGHAQQVVGLARHEVTLHDLRNPPGGFLEQLQVALFLTLQGDTDEHVGGKAGFGRVEQRHIAADQSAVLQRAHTPQGRRLGQGDPLGEFDVAQATVAL